jgi:hypothetical protein
MLLNEGQSQGLDDQDEQLNIFSGLCFENKKARREL